jgi:hypothetical protein
VIYWYRTGGLYLAESTIDHQTPQHSALSSVSISGPEWRKSTRELKQIKVFLKDKFNKTFVLWNLIFAQLQQVYFIFQHIKKNQSLQKI